MDRIAINKRAVLTRDKTVTNERMNERSNTRVTKDKTLLIGRISGACSMVLMLIVDYP